MSKIKVQDNKTKKSTLFDKIIIFNNKPVTLRSILSHFCFTSNHLIKIINKHIQ